MKKIIIVYFGFVNDKIQWWNIIGEQLLQLKSNGILTLSELHVFLSSESNECLKQCEFKVKQLIPESHTYTSNVNNYEYEGINLVWNLAVKSPENIYLYFHSKGISSTSNHRSMSERKLFKTIIDSWKNVIDIFSDNPNINKVGLTASEPGWMWFNFWWARGTYLSKCEQPIITTRRHYYEDWLCRRIKDAPASNLQECFSLADNKSGIYYTPFDACKKLESIKI